MGKKLVNKRAKNANNSGTKIVAYSRVSTKTNQNKASGRHSSLLQNQQRLRLKL